ncbi:MAG: molecular chaperone DnaJ [Pseudomonadota bacterium]|jgi:molecular chaperone DnaJ
MRGYRPDAYRLLGVSPRADAAAIRERYLALSRVYHPDRSGGSSTATEAFQQIAGAYKTLCDPGAREQHDRDLSLRDPLRFAEDTRAQRAVDALDQAVSGGRRRLPARKPGRDLRARVSLPFALALLGGETEVEVAYRTVCARCDGGGSEAPDRDPSCHVCAGSGQVRVGLRRERRRCEFCHGRGRVILRPCQDCEGAGERNIARSVTATVPVRCRDGALLRVRGAGEEGSHGGPAGDLVVDVRIGADPLFAIEGDDVVCRLPLTLREAALGGSVDVPSLEGIERLRLPIPVQPGQELRVPGRGAPRSRGGRGDLRYRIEVDVPRVETPGGAAAIEALDAALPAASWPRREAFTAEVARRRPST